MSELSPQETVERALAAAKSDDCVVIAEETSTANLRWAGNTLTTNGVAGSRQLTVIAIDRRADGAATGVVSRAGVRPDQIEDVVREAEHAPNRTGARARACDSPCWEVEPLVRRPSTIWSATWRRARPTSSCSRHRVASVSTWRSSSWRGRRREPRLDRHRTRSPGLRWRRLSGDPPRHCRARRDRVARCGSGPSASRLPPGLARKAIGGRSR